MAASTTNILGLAVGGGGLERGIAGALRRIGRAPRLVCAVEIEAYAAATLAARMEEGAVDDAPIWSDARTFDARAWRGVVDLVAAGYPCQPFSVAGKRLGADDPRHLWPSVARVVRECEPALCVFENVAGHMSSGAREVIGELQEMGFRVAASLWTAEEVGAPHRRERLFIVAAHPERIELRDEQGRSRGQDRRRTPEPRDDGPQGALSDAERVALRDPTGSDLRHEGPGDLVPRRDGEAQHVPDASCLERGRELPKGQPEADLDGDSRELANAARDRRDERGSVGARVKRTPVRRREGDALRGGEPSPGPTRLADADGERQPQPQGSISGEWRRALDCGRWWAVEPDVGRVAHGVAFRVERLRLLGNGVVPQCAEEAVLECFDALGVGGGPCLMSA